MTLADYSALIRPVSRDEVKRFRRWATSSGWAATTRGAVSTTQIVLTVVIAGIVLSVFAGFFTIVAGMLAGESVAGPFISVLVPSAVFLFAAAVAVAGYRAFAGSNATWEKRLRLREFAESRGCSYLGIVQDPPYAGTIFSIGRSRQAYDSVRANTGRALDVGNYRYTVKQGENSTTSRWGYIALHLDRRLPHMVLDATRNNGMFGSNLPSRFGRDSVLSLEGDFDRYFTLYCPPEYGRDALYVFTPDLMALLIDESSAFDVEIVDDWMFVYSPEPFDLLQPSAWDRLDRIVATVGSKTLDQTRLYADDRVADRSLNIVAPQGRRIRRSIGQAQSSSPPWPSSGSVSPSG